MIFSHSEQFIFFACGKTGTTSIEHVLMRYHDDVSVSCLIENKLNSWRSEYSRPFHLKHVRPSAVRAQMTTEEWKRFFKFVFVRNPWDWLFSNFCFNFPPLLPYLKRFDVIHAAATWELLKIHNQVVDLDGYYQYPFVFDADGLCHVDYVGRFETISEDWKAICAQLDHEPCRLPKLNRSTELDYRSVYTEEAIEFVADVLNDDVNRLGYSFEGFASSREIF